MRINRYNIDVVFRQITPELLAAQTYRDYKGFPYKNDDVIVSCNHISPHLFVNLAGTGIKGYSKDEREEQYKLLMEKMNGNFDSENSVFNLLYDFAQEVLTTQRYLPICRYNHILKWQDTTHKLGQDIFTTIYLAKKDTDINTKTDVFNWSPIIEHDNDRLKRMLSEGIAENHYHLNGSSQSFPINWVLVMNNINASRLLDKFGSDLQCHSSFGTEYNAVPWRSKLLWAAYIRMYLFKKIHAPESADDELGKIMELLGDTDILFADLKIGELMKKLNILKREYGYKAPYDNVCLDYAILKTMKSDNLYFNKILVGERKLLYDCFCKIRRNEFSYTDKNLLYLYILIKSNFRGEFIQINEDVGFKNFADYQDRKEFFYDKNFADYANEALRISLNSVLHCQPVVSLEARIMPKAPSWKMFNKIKKITDVFDEFEKHLENAEVIEKGLNNKDKYFFVVHYPKSKYQLEKDGIIPYCRNHMTREINRKFTRAIILSLGVRVELRDKILGFDGCANEIGCRPETFATDFRCLRIVIPQNKSGVLVSHENPTQLKFTYHAGEDFLNIPDGLRAIDEAVKFFGMRHNDRIGHALALGINAEEYYKSKNYRIIMPKQDALDDEVWMLYRANELNIPIEVGLEKKLMYHIQQRMRYIYGDVEKDQSITLDPYYYYCSWKLRGDAPELYSKGYFEDNNNKILPRYEQFKVNKFLDDPSIRNNKSVAYLYYAYHYDYEVKARGFETEVINIDESYINLVKQIQEKMRFEIAKNGIMIECNPSSNYLIGTFNRYDEHPITVLNNLELEISEQKKAKCPQISVSINTDDQGVFDTSLVNEYAIMASALENKKDSQGNAEYSASQVYRYLDSVRKMGIEQSFKSNNRAVHKK